MLQRPKKHPNLWKLSNKMETPQFTEPRVLVRDSFTDPVEPEPEIKRRHARDSIDEDAVDPDQFLKKAKRLVVEAFNARTEYESITIDDVYIVWFAKVLQNWKALVSTDVMSGVYYEVTYNGDKHETYLDAYTRQYKVTIAD